MTTHLKAVGATDATLCGISAGTYFTTELDRNECEECAALPVPVYGEADFPSAVCDDNGRRYSFAGTELGGAVGMYDGMSGYSFTLSMAWAHSWDRSELAL